MTDYIEPSWRPPQTHPNRYEYCGNILVIEATQVQERLQRMIGGPSEKPELTPENSLLLAAKEKGTARFQGWKKIDRGRMRVSPIELTTTPKEWSTIA